jgi:hypothetical protein
MTAMVLLLVLAQASAGSPEAGMVTLAGDGELVAAMQRSLALRGIAVVPNDVEGAVHLQIQPDAAGLRIFIRDRNGNVVQRAAATPEVGAVVVESWMREDLSQPLLAPHAVVTPVDLPAPPRAPPPPAPAPLHASVVVASQTSLGTDNSLWMGASVGACVRVGWVCLGLQTQVAGDTALAGDVGARYAPEGGASCRDTDPTLPRQLTRMGAGALATVDLPLRIGAGTIGPGLGVGAGWQSTRASLGDHSGSATSIGLRTATHLFLSWPLVGALALDLGLWADLLPLAHTGDLSASGFALPGEPLGFVRLEVGLRYGSMGASP